MASKIITWIVFVSCISCVLSQPVKDDTFSLRILHTNDMHSRFEQISQSGGKCSDSDAANNKCYGGFARVRTAVKEQRKKAEAENVPVLFLNAGDTYQGTIWYTVYKWRVVARFLDMLGIDAMSLGNHEFDDGVDGLVPFLNNVSTPVVTCNLGLDNVPELKDTPLKPSMIFEINGRKVGVIGYLTPETKSLSNVGKVEIYDEVSSISAEAKKLKDQKVDVIIGVGHSGYDADLRIAKQVPDLDAIIGGHTNTFLYTGDPPDSEIPVGLYPEIVTQDSGRKVSVVQAYAYTKYLGIITLKFDADGELLEANGDPIVLNSKVAQDPEVLEEIGKWKEGIANITKEEVGKAKVFLDGDCRFFECNLGNLITDAYVHYGVKNFIGSGWTNAPIAVQQGGGIRTSIDVLGDEGVITREDVMLAMPFYNALTIYQLQGKYLLEALEWSVERYDPTLTVGRGEFLQVSGLKVVYDLTKPIGSRVASVRVRCGNCSNSVPRYEPLNEDVSYNIIMPVFLAEGGDNFTVFQENGKQIISFDALDTDVVTEFIQERGLIYHEIENRIVFENDTGLSHRTGSSSAVEVNYVLISALVLFFVFSSYNAR